MRFPCAKDFFRQRQKLDNKILVIRGKSAFGTRYILDRGRERDREKLLIYYYERYQYAHMTQKQIWPMVPWKKIHFRVYTIFFALKLTCGSPTAVCLDIIWYLFVHFFISFILNIGVTPWAVHYANLRTNGRDKVQNQNDLLVVWAFKVLMR